MPNPLLALERTKHDTEHDGPSPGCPWCRIERLESEVIVAQRRAVAVERCAEERIAILKTRNREIVREEWRASA